MGHKYLSGLTKYMKFIAKIILGNFADSNFFNFLNKKNSHGCQFLVFQGPPEAQIYLISLKYI